jgi:hypothetical protein
MLKAVGGPDRAQEDRHDHDLPDAGDGDVPEAVPGVGTVDLCLFVKFGGNGLEGREDRDEPEGKAAPHRGKDHRGHRSRPLTQPVDDDLTAGQVAEDEIYAAADRLVEHAPGEEGNEGRHRPW